MQKFSAQQQHNVLAWYYVSHAIRLKSSIGGRIFLGKHAAA
jgi:hypothetical protein